MQIFSDNSFFVWLAVLSIPAVVLGIMEKTLKYYGMSASLIMLWLVLGGNDRAMGYLVLFVLCQYAVIHLYLQIRSKGNRSRVLFAVFLGISIMPLVSYKLLELTDNPHHILGFMGISYMTFKVVQMLIEIYDGIINEIRGFEYAYLMLFFPTILSGPIDRSRRFNADLERRIPRSEYMEMVGDGIYRILLGMVYKIVVAALLHHVMTAYGMGRDPASILIYYYTYGFYLFFDFAGYSMMAIGAGYILGIRVPDNFNKPFASKNINEFWNRWHITLSHWLRDYVFSRITMTLMRTGLRKSKLTIACSAFMINMIIMGLWHGFNWYYIVYGAYHGVLLSVYEIVRKMSARYKKYSKKKWFEVIEWVLTLHLVLLGFFIFSGRLDALL